jgi:hypothetical protein
MTSSNSGFGRRQCVRSRCRVGFATGVVTRAAIASLGVACSGAGNEGGAPGTGAPDVDGPLYALGVRFVTADTTVGYIVTVPSLEAGATWNLDRAIEVGQDAWLSGSEGAGEVILVSSRDPSVRRWRLGSDGALQLDAELTFGNLGLVRSREARGRTAIDVGDKAYFMSSDGQLVVWSPRDMAIVGTIPWSLPFNLDPEGIFTGDDDRVLMTANFYRNDTADTSIYQDDVHLVEIDPRTDQIVSDVTEPRCNNLSAISRSPNGTTYHSPRAPIASFRATLGEGHGPKDCSLRIMPSSNGYDPSFDVNLSTLVGGRPAGGLFALNDDIAFIRVWHEELAPPLAPDRSNYEDLMFASAYQWWRWPIGSSAAELIEGQPPTTGQWDPHQVEGRTLVPLVAADFSSTELVELFPDGSLRPLISGPGTLLGVVRIR